MINDKTLDHILHDFNTSIDHETLVIPAAQLVDFWNWFKNTSEYYDVVQVDEQLIDAKFLAGRCYGNAQIASIETGLEYIEGFAKSTDRFILHGFNLKEGAIIDVTVQNHIASFEKHFGGVPKVYVGVKIPLEIIQQYNGDSIQNGHININHLLYQMFLLENQ